MPHCMVPGCTNGSRKTKGTDISFHRLPKDEKISKLWLTKTRRKNPAKRDSSYVCSVHFMPDCFQTSLKHLCGQQNKKTLKPGSIPTIFPHTGNKCERFNSIQRRRNQDRNEVRFYSRCNFDEFNEFKKDKHIICLYFTHIYKL